MSLADGYRVMLAYPSTDFFANLKLELSQDSRYPQDKQTVVESLRYLSNQSSREARTSVPIERPAYRGVDVYGVNFPTIDFYIENNPPTLGGGPIGTYVLFDDPRKVIVTVYFLNQRPGGRRFKTTEEVQNSQGSISRRLHDMHGPDAIDRSAWSRQLGALAAAALVLVVAHTDMSTNGTNII